MARLTVSDLAARQEATDTTLAALVDTQTALLQAVQALGQHSTPAAVLDKVKAKAPAPINPRDVFKTGVERKGLALAKGGALQGSVAVAEAIVRVLKANKVGGFEVVSVQGDVESLDTRHVTHIGVLLVAPGHFTTQYIYTPEKA